jgi:cytochrome c-type biogenesis protein CcmH/NrfF
MHKWKSSILVILLTAICIAQTPTQLLTPAIRRVGDKLSCLCGSCKNTVATCQMLECHYSHPARLEIATMQAAGASDETIVASFVKKSGLQALAVPPAQGFSLMAWVMPVFVILLGLTMIWLFVKRFRKPFVPAEIDQTALDRYNQQIEKDMAKFE